MTRQTTDRKPDTSQIPQRNEKERSASSQTAPATLDDIEDITTKASAPFTIPSSITGSSMGSGNNRPPDTKLTDDAAGDARRPRGHYGESVA